MEFKTSEEKLNYINEYLIKLMSISEKAIVNKKYNQALAALSAYCEIQYLINQKYYDEKTEDLLLHLSREIICVPKNFFPDNNTILFYDGFGLDLRGWAASYARALSSLGYAVVYVAPLQSQNNIPHIQKEISQGKGIIEYVDFKKNYIECVESLSNIFNQYKPKTAFFYTKPYDVSAATVFDAYYGKVTRIQVDLTDHAFWVGVKAVDKCIESRDLGVSNAIYHRGINRTNIVRMDGCPYINREISDEPLPIDIEKEKYIFSGGSLYKTLGDEDLYFYKILDYILEKHTEVKFIFAGRGDDTELKKIIQKFPQRAFHIQEREDFFRLFQNCIFFLNTYPMFGGLMMRYSALAGKIPLTLKHGSDNEGLLYQQEELGIEFDTFEDIVKEADKLILDENYRSEKEKKLTGSVTTEEEYAMRIQMVIENGKTDLSFGQVPEIDTSKFRAEYLERFSPNKVLLDTIIQKKKLSILPFFPLMTIKKLLRRQKI